MSKISLAPNASGTGNFTIASPATNTDRTLTLPDNTGTILTSASNTNFPTGSVVQVVEATTTTQVTNSTTTYVDTGLTATITPSSTSNKILVIVTQQCYKSSGHINNGANIKLFRNSTDFGRMVYAQGFTGTAIELYSMAAFQYLDSPSTTSATTYKTQFNNNTNSALASVQADSIGRSTIILLEIKG